MELFSNCRSSVPLTQQQSFLREFLLKNIKVSEYTIAHKLSFSSDSFDVVKPLINISDPTEDPPYDARKLFFDRLIDSDIELCSICNDTFRLLCNKAKRCSCVIARRKPRIIFVCLSRKRYPSHPNVGSFFSNIFLKFFFLATTHFTPELQEYDIITPKSLQDAHIFAIDPNGARPILSEHESELIDEFIARGGTLLCNCFSMYNEAGARFKKRLGIISIPQAQVLNRTEHLLKHTRNSCDLVLNGPFGKVSSIKNKGESQFKLNRYAIDTLGALPLGYNIADGDAIKTTFAYYPPEKSRGRLGQVFAVGNFHMFADAKVWDGGEIEFTGNYIFAANLMSSAVSLKSQDLGIRSLKDICREVIRKNPCSGLEYLPKPLIKYVALYDELIGSHDEVRMDDSFIGLWVIKNVNENSGFEIGDKLYISQTSVTFYMGKRAVFKARRLGNKFDLLIDEREEYVTLDTLGWGRGLIRGSAVLLGPRLAKIGLLSGNSQIVRLIDGDQHNSWFPSKNAQRATTFLTLTKVHEEYECLARATDMTTVD
eukprot:UC4_evm2s420